MLGGEDMARFRSFMPFSFGLGLSLTCGEEGQVVLVQGVPMRLDGVGPMWWIVTAR